MRFSIDFVVQQFVNKWISEINQHIPKVLECWVKQSVSVPPLWNINTSQGLFSFL